MAYGVWRPGTAMCKLKLTWLASHRHLVILDAEYIPSLDFRHSCVCVVQLAVISEQESLESQATRPLALNQDGMTCQVYLQSLSAQLRISCRQTCEFSGHVWSGERNSWRTLIYTNGTRVH